MVEDRDTIGRIPAHRNNVAFVERPGVHRCSYSRGKRPHHFDEFEFVEISGMDDSTGQRGCRIEQPARWQSPPIGSQVTTGK
jgi:hypothetical protein